MSSGDAECTVQYCILYTHTLWSVLYTVQTSGQARTTPSPLFSHLHLHLHLHPLAASDPIHSLGCWPFCWTLVRSLLQPRSLPKELTPPLDAPHSSLIDYIGQAQGFNVSIIAPTARTSLRLSVFFLSICVPLVVTVNHPLCLTPITIWR